MGIERARVVEVHSTTSAAGRVGAGYLIGDRLVLTAGDIVGRRGATDVRRASTATWYPAAPVWSSRSGDATILEVEDPLAAAGAMRWGDVSGLRPVPVTAIGFPPADRPSERFRDAEQFFGHLRTDRLEASETSRLAGGGLHGAALFAGAELVGLVTATPDRLRAVAVSAFAGDPSFVSWAGEGGRLDLVTVRAASGFSIL